MIGLLIAYSQTPPSAQWDYYPAAPKLLNVTERLGIGLQRNAYHVWLDRLVDRCIVAVPSGTLFRSRTAYDEAVRFRTLVDRPHLYTDGQRAPQDGWTADDWLCAGLVRWSKRLDPLNGLGTAPAVTYASAIEAFDRARDLSASSADENVVLTTYADLASGLCAAESEGLQAKDRLYRLEVSWRDRYPHTSLIAAAALVDLYKKAGDEANETLTRARIRVRYGKLRDYAVYQRWS